MKKVDYSKNITPESYVCSQCRATGIKLWRQSSTFLEHIELMCAECVCEHLNVDISSMDDSGRVETEHGRTDQVGYMIPAVPTKDDSFWGYTSVPEDGVNWWHNLPNNIKRLRKNKIEQINENS